ncbi:MAG: Uma2 family endonuclease [Planctomycetaceae bacterium]
MLTAVKRRSPIKPKPTEIRYGPSANGRLVSPREFDRGDFQRGWRYELVNGVLIVSPAPVLSERDPNEELGHILRTYQEHHPQGSALDLTVNEHDVETGDNRRRADRAIWTGLGRLPRKNETPSIVVEFVSGSRRDWVRDYETKRDEYLNVGVQEYWIFDRFAQTLTVWTKNGRRAKRVLTADQTLSTPRLPGLVLGLRRLFDLANRWEE